MHTDDLNKAVKDPYIDPKTTALEQLPQSKNSTGSSSFTSNSSSVLSPSYAPKLGKTVTTNTAVVTTDTATVIINIK